MYSIITANFVEFIDLREQIEWKQKDKSLDASFEIKIDTKKATDNPVCYLFK